MNNVAAFNRLFLWFAAFAVSFAAAWNVVPVHRAFPIPGFGAFTAHSAESVFPAFLLFLAAWQASTKDRFISLDFVSGALFATAAISMAYWGLVEGLFLLLASIACRKEQAVGEVSNGRA